MRPSTHAEIVLHGLLKVLCFTYFVILVVLFLPDSDNFGIPRTLKRHISGGL